MTGQRWIEAKVVAFGDALPTTFGHGRDGRPGRSFRELTADLRRPKSLHFLRDYLRTARKSAPTRSILENS
jgi:hypothetical protein